MDEVTRVLSPEGEFLVSFPNRLFPGNPHDLPPFFSLLPREVGIEASRLLGEETSEYYRNHVFNVSPIAARKLLSTRFRRVEYTTLEYLERFPEVYEGSTLGELLLTLRPAIMALTRTSIGERIFELSFGYSAYRCTFS